MEKRNQLLIDNLLDQNSGGIRDTSSNKTLVKAKTLLTASRVKKLDFENLSLKSPWVETPIIWAKILKVWMNYRRNLKQLEEGLEKRIFKIIFL